MLTLDVPYRILWHCLRARWRGSLTQSIVIELGRLPAPHHTITLCGCKSLHRQLIQPCRLLRLQLLKQLIGRYANTLRYDRLGFIPRRYQIQSTGDGNPLLLEKTVCAFYSALTFKTVYLMITHCSISLSPLLSAPPPLLFSLPLSTSFAPSPMGLSTLIKTALLKGHSIFLGLTSTDPRLLHAASSFRPISPTWLPPLVQRSLLRGSQSNNTAFEAKAIIRHTMHTLIWLPNPSYSLIY